MAIQFQTRFESSSDDASDAMPPFGQYTGQGTNNGTYPQIRTDVPGGVSPKAMRVRLVRPSGDNTRIYVQPSYRIPYGSNKWVGCAIYLEDDWVLSSSQIGKTGSIFAVPVSITHSGTGPGGGISTKLDTSKAIPYRYVAARGTNHTWTDGKDEDHKDLGPIIKTQWTYFAWRTKYTNQAASSSSPPNAEWWRKDGVNGTWYKANERWSQTQTTTTSLEVRFGLYEGSGINHTRTIWFDNCILGDTFAEVDPSHSGAAIPPPANAPGKVANLTATRTDDDIALAWDLPSGTVTSYNIYRSVNGGADSLIGSGSTVRTFADNNRPAGSVNRYNVVALNGTSAGPAGDPATETIPITLQDLSALDDNAPRAAINAIWAQRSGSPSVANNDYSLPPSSEIKTDRVYTVPGRRLVVGPFTAAARGTTGQADLTRMRLSILSSDDNTYRVSLRMRQIGSDPTYLDLQVVAGASDPAPTPFELPANVTHLALGISDDGNQAFAEYSTNGTTFTSLGSRDISALDFDTNACKVAVATDMIAAEGTVTPATVTRIRGMVRTVTGNPPSVTNIQGPGNDLSNPVFSFNYSGDTQTLFRWRLRKTQDDADDQVSEWVNLGNSVRSVQAGANLLAGEYTWELEVSNASGGPLLYTKTWTIAQRSSPVAPSQNGRGAFSFSVLWPNPPASFIEGDFWQLYVNGQMVVANIPSAARGYTYQHESLVDGVPVNVQMSYGVEGNYSQLSPAVQVTPGAVVSGAAVEFYTFPSSLEVSSGGSMDIKTVKLQLSATGSGIPAFQIIDSAPWMAVTPATGTAPAELTVTLDPAGLALGNHDGTITISAAGSVPLPSAVALSIIETGKVSGEATIAISTPTSTISTDRIYIEVNGDPFADLPLGTTSYKLTGLTDNASYSVQAYVGTPPSRLGPDSNVLSVVTYAQSAPTNTAIPAVSGLAKVGETLTATQGTWVNNPTGYAYQWQRNTGTWANISGANANTYAVTSADIGATIRVQVTATNVTGSTSAVSGASGPVPNPTGIASLTDDFDDNSLGAMWSVGSAGGVSETDQRIRMIPPTSTGAGTARTLSTGYTNTILDSSASIQVVNFWTGSNGYFIFRVQNQTSPSDNYAQIRIAETRLQLTEYAGGVAQSIPTSTWPTYDSAVHKYLRIRESAGTLYFEYSTDGSTWTVIHSKSRSVQFTGNQAVWMSGGWSANTTPAPTGLVELDNFNMIGTGVVEPPPVTNTRQVVDTGVAGTTGSVTTTTVSLSNGPATAGNLIVAALAVDKLSGSITIPVESGFTHLLSRSSTSVSFAFAYKIADGTETGLTWSWASGRTHSACIAEISGLDTFHSWISPAYSDTTKTSQVLGPLGPLGANGGAIAAIGIDSGSGGFLPTGTGGFTRIVGHAGTSGQGQPGVAILANLELVSADTPGTTLGWSSSDQIDALLASFTV